MTRPHDPAFVKGISGPSEGELGLTKREWFAGLAMKECGFQANSSYYEAVARQAVTAADALIKALNEKEKP